MKKNAANPRMLAPANRDTRKLSKEPLLTQMASFVELFVWLLVLKSFFLPLFIIPTGSMAETLAGEYATYTCPNCGHEFPVGFHESRGPEVVQCPNCRLQQPTARVRADGVHLISKAGDRIIVHGWPYDIGGWFAPRRWDVVVFKNPNEPDVNFIKRLIGLPGETIEIIDGDIFVREPGEAESHPAQKTKYAQRALWFPYYDHDYPPRETTTDWLNKARSRDPRYRGYPLPWPNYHPRWLAAGESATWSDLASRTPRFRGKDAGRDEISFVGYEDPTEPNEIFDVYGYNGADLSYHNVTDTRLSVDARILAGDGYVELVNSKYENVFFARLYADGRLTLEHGTTGSDARESWGEVRVKLPELGVHLALGHADYHVAVELDGRTVLESTPERYPVTAEQAKTRSRLKVPPILRIAAERIDADFAHLKIDRDEHYVSGNIRDGGASPGTGTQDHPITLKNAYFVCGDNSPGSNDSRCWGAAQLGPHLRQAYTDGAYDLGTVPANQMIGRAFFVYWPGFLPLSEKGPNLLPDFGRIRWIH